MTDNAATVYPAVGAGAGTGNRCWHDPAAPDLDPRYAPANRQQIRVLDRLDRRLAPLYDRARGRREHRVWRSMRAARHAAGVVREIPRSESREAALRLLRLMARRTCLLRWEVGVPSEGADDGFYRWTWAELAAALEMSEVRVRRAGALLKAAGWIHVQGRGEGLTATKKLTMQFIRALGLGDAIDSARNKRRNRRPATRAERAEQSASRMAQRALLEAARRRADRFAQDQPGESPESPQPPPADHGRTPAGQLADMLRSQGD